MAVWAHAGISLNSIPLSFVADSCGLPFMHTAVRHYFFLSSLRHRPLMIVFFVNDLPTNRKGFVPAIFALVRSLLFTLARPSLLSLLMFSSYSLPSLLPPPLLLPLHRNQVGFLRSDNCPPGRGEQLSDVSPLTSVLVHTFSLSPLRGPQCRPRGRPSPGDPGPHPLPPR